MALDDSAWMVFGATCQIRHNNAEPANSSAWFPRPDVPHCRKMLTIFPFRKQSFLIASALAIIVSIAGCGRSDASRSAGERTPGNASTASPVAAESNNTNPVSKQQYRGDPQPYPAGLSDAAFTFKSADPCARLQEANSLIALLPKCPVKSRKQTTTGAIISYDYSRPSYLLRADDLTALLGQPLCAIPNTFSYTYNYLVRAASLKSGRCVMGIEFRNDCVVRAGWYCEP